MYKKTTFTCLFLACMLCVSSKLQQQLCVCEHVTDKGRQTAMRLHLAHFQSKGEFLLLSLPSTFQGGSLMRLFCNTAVWWGEGG